jgi:hypothetical protein
MPLETVMVRLSPIRHGKTSLITPELAGVLPVSVQQAIVRNMIRQAAAEDPALLERCIACQSLMDEHGRGGCYDAARPELAAQAAL